VLNVDVSRPPSTVDHAAHLTKLIAAGQRGDAVEYFQRLVGIPDEIIFQMRDAPFPPARDDMAHTLVYETTIMDGGDSPDWMRHAARVLAGAVANGQHCSLEGQTHDLVPEAIGPVLRDFLAR
jgi:hypothetical protein